MFSYRLKYKNGDNNFMQIECNRSMSYNFFGEIELGRDQIFNARQNLYNLHPL